ncbi:MAG TPA: hypothetical protein VHV31_06745 [Nitrolancea sp.]|jgi:hypothetical protein|nr:hypothetical protein [Nitrolancea sp.]
MRADWIQKIEKWKRWIEEIHSETSQLVFRRIIWDELVNIIQSNRQIQISSAFYDWLPAVYAPAQAMGIRRIADVDSYSKPVSLGNLLTDMRDCSEILQMYVEEIPLKIGTASLTREMPNPSSDLQQLLHTIEPIKRYADKRIAHLDSNAASTIIRYGDISGAIDLISSLTVEYYAFLCNSHYMVEPVFTYYWQQIFNVPWIPQSEDAEDEE